MAIERNPLLSLVGGTGVPEDQIVSEDIEIEIEDPDDLEELGLDSLPLEMDAGAEDHYANLAEYIDEERLDEIGLEVYESFDADRESRSEWESTFERGFDLLGLKLQETTEPFEGSCTAVSPLIIESSVKFQSKASIELFPSGGPVRTQIIGDPSEEREAQSTRVQDFMNYQFTEQMPEYFDEFEKMLFHLPLIGSAFKKMYYDPSLRRPVSEFIPIDQFYVSYHASDLQKAERYTHVIYRSMTEMERDIVNGMYLDADIGDPSTPDPTSFTSKIDSIMGISPAEDWDQQYVLLEQHCYLNLPEPFEHPDDISLPYVVTVDQKSQKVIAIRRNWSKEDVTQAKQTYFTHYKFVPGFGFYGLGLIHLLGNLAMSATSALRSLVDAAQFSNLPGGFKARGVRIVGGNDPIAPGEFREVEATGLDLQKSIVPLPYKEPSQTLFNMLSWMTGAGQKFADSTEQIVNESSNYGPVGTTMALIESSAKFFSAIHKRLHKSQRDEFRILSKINFEFLPDEYPYDVPNVTSAVFKSDFDGRVDVIPVSDPNIPSAAHRLSMAQMVLQLSSQAPQGMYNIQQVHLSILKAANIQNPDRFFTPQQQPKAHDPITDIELVVKGMPIQAFMEQDHAAHIAVKTAFIEDPTLGKTEMMAPAVPVLQANIQQHMVMQYQQQMQGLINTAQQGQQGQVSPEVMSQLSIDAAEKVLQANIGEADENSLENQNLLLEAARLDLDQQKLQMTATKDSAELSIKNRELDLKEMGVKLDAANKVATSEQNKMDAEIRDDASIRTTNAKLTVESLKNLAKERDLMIDKRMNEDRYASGGTVGLAEGGLPFEKDELFQEFLSARGGREGFENNPIGDALESFFAKIGGGRERTVDEQIADAYETYKMELADTDNPYDTDRLQALLAMENKYKSETPTVESDLQVFDEDTIEVGDQPIPLASEREDKTLLSKMTKERIPEIQKGKLRPVEENVNLNPPEVPFIDRIPEIQKGRLRPVEKETNETFNLNRTEVPKLNTEVISESSDVPPSGPMKNILEEVEKNETEENFTDRLRAVDESIKLNTTKVPKLNTQVISDLPDMPTTSEPTKIGEDFTATPVSIDSKVEQDILPKNIAPIEMKPSMVGSTPKPVSSFEPGSVLGTSGPKKVMGRMESPIPGMKRVFQKVDQALPEVQKELFKKSRFNMKGLDKFNKNANPEDVVAQFEKFKGDRYFATDFEEKEGLYTVGFGDTQSKKKKVTEEEAMGDLKKRLDKVGKKVDDIVKVPLSKNQRTAIISLIDNVGIGAFQRSNALKALNEGDYDEFHNQAFSFENGFVNQNGKPLKGLVRRRASEGNLFKLK